MYTEREIEKLLEEGKSLEDILKQQESELKEKINTIEMKKAAAAEKEKKKDKVNKELARALGNWMIIQGSIEEDELSDETMEVLLKVIESLDGKSRIGYKCGDLDSWLKILF